MINFSETKINHLYSKLLIDPDFDHLENLGNQPNIFEILGVSHFEIRHSHFLAWLLNPNGNHGIGNYILKRFLIHIIQDPRANYFNINEGFDFNVLSVHKLLQEDITIYREKYDIDILIEFDTAIIVIENKIHAGEGDQQLMKYKNIILKHYPNKKPIFVYLTKFGDEASLKEYYIEVSYQNDVLGYLNDLINYRSETLQDHVLNCIKDYIYNLKKNVMQINPANVLAEKLYRQHQELFDFVFNHRADPIAVIKSKMLTLLENEDYKLGSKHMHYLRFLPQKVYDIIPKCRQNSDWREGELLLIELRFPTNKQAVEFKISISPYHPQSISKVMQQLCEQIGLRESGRTNNNWISYEKKEYLIDYSRFDDDDYLKEFYQQMMADHKSKIDLLTQNIIENQYLLNS